MPYKDFREYLDVLERRGKLHRIKAEVDKDWEISAVGRRMFQKFAARNRVALFFENVKGFSSPVTLGVLGASKEIYMLALEAESNNDIIQKWKQGLNHPLTPRLVDTGPCKEVIHRGEDVNLLDFPIPIWTVGQDPGPYITAPYICTKDPETGARNVGTYRTQVKGKDRVGVFITPVHHGMMHIKKNDALNKPTPVAIVIGADPTLGLCAVAPVPTGVDEFAVAGGLRGEPMELVKCETVDLEVPAAAEIVIEGEFLSNYRELEGPFGEFTGYIGPAGLNPLMQVKCITHRKNPIFQAFISEMPPSESSMIRGLGHSLAFLTHLRDVLGLPVIDLCLRESGGGAAYMVISMKKDHPGQPKQAIWGAWGYDGGYGKIAVVVDEDIDPHDDFQVDWAMSYRMQPARDVFIETNTPPLRLDPSVGTPDMPQHEKAKLMASKIGIDATKKHDFPPLALPPREHLEKVDRQWDKYGF